MEDDIRTIPAPPQDYPLRISLERGGKFRAATMIPNTHKCAAMATKTYKYNVKIHARATRLSPEGFVFNNERVQAFFDNRYGVKAPPWEAVSCEILAIRSAQELARILTEEGIDLICVECTIWGSNGAQIIGTCDVSMGGLTSQVRYVVEANGDGNGNGNGNGDKTGGVA